MSEGVSVIVKGMAMPKNCQECGLYIEGACYAKGYRDYRSIMDTAKPDDCPLVELPEKHGRLVDADKLADLLSKEKEKVVGEGNLFLCFAVGFAWGFIAKEPTVVEAEGGKA